MKTNHTVARLFLGCALIAGFASCGNSNKGQTTESKSTSMLRDSLQDYVNKRINIYESVKLTTDLNELTVNERKILAIINSGSTNNG